MMIGTARIIRGNALALPLGDASVDLVVTSPPYFGLRSYQDDGAHYAGQIGSEATPAEFVDTLIAATREMVRVLKPSGSIWVNLGDKYNSAASGQNGTSATGLEGGRHDRMSGRGTTVGRIPTKSLMGIPWRYALRCIDDLGLILRAEIIWAKPNGLPESVTDRVRRSHETWFHFTREPRYFSAVDEIRETHTGPPPEFYGRQQNPSGVKQDPSNMSRRRAPGQPGALREYNPLGKLPGSVWTINEGESLVRSVLTAVSEGGVSVDEGERLLWTLTACANGEHAQGPPSVWVIPTQPLTVPAELGVDHFAAFPMEWPRRIIQGWSPAGVCTACGEGRRPVKGVDWGKVPHRLELRRSREPTESERAEAGRLTLAWRTAAGIKRSDFVPHFPHYKNADSVTAQVSNWERGKNVPMPDDLAIMEVILGPAPQRLREIVGDMDMLPVSLLRKTGDFAVTGRHRTVGGGLNSADYRAISGYACGCDPSADHIPNAWCDAGSMCPGACLPPTRASIILDPFGGTGTTALVAKALGRIGISVDMSADYCRLAEWRCNDPGQMAAALQVERPEPVSPDQLDLFSGEFEAATATRPNGGLAYSKARGQDCGACGYRMQYAGRATCEKCGATR